MDRSLVSSFVMREVRHCRQNSRKLKAFVGLLAFVTTLGSAGCGLRNQGRESIPAEVQAAVDTVSEDLKWERYQKIYDETSTHWKRDATAGQSTEVLKNLRAQLGVVESRSLHSATEQTNSGGALQGHVFIISYQTKFERGEGMETFTLVEEGGHWKLARYFVNSTALK